MHTEHHVPSHSHFLLVKYFLNSKLKLFLTMVDHGQSWFNLKFMVDHGLTVVILLPNNITTTTTTIIIILIIIINIKLILRIYNRNTFIK